MTTTMTRMVLLAAATALTAASAKAQIYEDASRYPQAVVYTPGYAPVVAPPVVAVQQPVVPQLTDEQLDQLLAPIALYPDPLLAQLLPASVYPSEVVLAMRWLQANPQPDENLINIQPWEPSIKALVHYPSVLQLLNDHIDWTQALGAAFVNQTQDVSLSIQRLRLQAQAAGALASTPQQTVMVDQGVVQILPASPQLIYVPVYDPQVVYVRRPVRPVITFSVGFRVGGWLDNDFDWRHHVVAVGTGWHPGWVFDDHRGWRRDERPVVQVRERPRAWVPNPIKPRPVLPPALVRPVRDDEHRGWAPPAPTPRQAPFALPVRHEEPRHVEPQPVTPAPKPVPGAFGGYQSRAEVERAQERARQVLPPAATPKPAPAATPAPRTPVLRPGMMPTTPTLRPTGPVQPTSPSAFQGQVPATDVRAESQRGHESMRH